MPAYPKNIILICCLWCCLFPGKAIGQNFAPDSVIAYYSQQIHPDSIQVYMQALENFGTRFCLADNRKNIANWIMAKFQSFGFDDVRLDSFPYSRTYFGVHYQTWQYNVICSFPGYSGSDSIFILGAHYDAIVPYSSQPFVHAPGADDNASGVAATLEIARVMKHHNYQPAYNIQFVAFAAEEFGLHGSWDFANKAYNSGMNIICMINNDMVSYCTLPENEWKVSIQKYANSDWFTSLAHTTINNFTTLTAVESTQYIQYSDSWPFYQKGFKAIFFIENQFTPFYHTINDLVATTNKMYAAEMTKISMGMLVYLNGNGSPAGSIPEVLLVKDTLIYAGYETCFNATQSIVVAGAGSSFEVFEGGIVHLIAGEQIMLCEGFVVHPGAFLHARITSDSSYCVQTETLHLQAAAINETLELPAEIKLHDLLTIFPNPTQDICTVQFNGNITDPFILLAITNLQGQTVFEQQLIQQSSFRLNLSAVPPGIYLFRLQFRDKTFFEKIVKY